MRSTSATQIKAYRRCPRRWYYGWVKRVQQPKGDALIDGILMHAAIELYLLDKGNLWPSPELVRARALEGERDAEVRDAIKARDNAHVEHLIDCASAVEPHITRERPYPAEWVERSIDYPVLEDVRARGRMDLVEPYSKDRARITDWKSISDWKWMPTEDELVHDPQTLLYANDVFRATDTDWVWVRYVYISKTQREARKVAFSVRRSEHEERWPTIVDTVEAQRRLARDVDDPEQVPANERACDDYGGCPFRDRCSVGQPSLIAAMKKAQEGSSVGLLDKWKTKKLDEAKRVTDEAIGKRAPVEPETQSSPSSEGDRQTPPQGYGLDSPEAEERHQLMKRLQDEGGCLFDDLKRRSLDELRFMASQLDDPVNPPDGMDKTEPGERPMKDVVKDAKLPSGKPVKKALVKELYAFFATWLKVDEGVIKAQKKALGWSASDLKTEAARLVTYGLEDGSPLAPGYKLASRSPSDVDQDEQTAASEAPATTPLEDEPYPAPTPQETDDDVEEVDAVGDAAPAPSSASTFEVPDVEAVLTRDEEEAIERDAAAYAAMLDDDEPSPFVPVRRPPILYIGCRPDWPAQRLEQWARTFIDAVESRPYEGRIYSYFAAMPYAVGPKLVAAEVAAALDADDFEWGVFELVVDSASQLAPVVDVLLRAGCRAVRAVAA